MNRPTPFRPLTLLVPVVLALLLAACGAQLAPELGTTIGPAGGSVSSADGNATLVIPPGALDQDVSISVKAVSNPPAASAGSSLVTGSAYEIDAGGDIEFSEAAELTIEYDAAAIQGAIPAQGAAPAATSFVLRRWNGSAWQELSSGACTEVASGTMRCAIVQTGVYAVFGISFEEPGIAVQTVNGSPLPASRAVTVDAAVDLVVRLGVTAGDEAVDSVTATVDGSLSYEIPLAEGIAAGSQAEVEVAIEAGVLPARPNAYSIVLSAAGLEPTEPILVTVAESVIGANERRIDIAAVNGNSDYDGMTIYSDQSISFTVDVAVGSSATGICHLYLYYNAAGSGQPTGMTDVGWSINPCISAGQSSTHTLTISAQTVASIIQFIPPRGGYYDFYFGSASSGSASGITMSEPARLNLQPAQ